VALKVIKPGWSRALLAALAILAAAPDAHAQRQVTRLGNPATRFTPPVNSVAALQKTFRSKTTQAAVGTVLDKAGLASLTPQVLAALTEGRVTDTSVEPGTAIRWMALRRGGKPDILLDAVWAGKAPFKAFAFTIEDGTKTYNFVVPKACGNLSLISQTEKPLPECFRIAMTRDCAAKQVTFTAAGTAISNNQTTVIKVLRDGQQVGELLPASGFKGTFPLQPGRYTFMATDTYGREFGTCERDYVVEACAAPAPPPPPPPPAATSCGALVSVVAAGGGWNFYVDASGSGRGASPASKAVVQLIGPDGTPVPFLHEGDTRTEFEMVPPFYATFFVAKAKPGTYTIQGMTSAVNPAAAPSVCEATVTVASGGTSEQLPPWFPWPPPPWTWREDLRFDLIRTAPADTYDVVFDRIATVMKAAHVEAWSVYPLPIDGFAVVTRLERIDDKANPIDGLDGRRRWLTDVHPPMWSPEGILERLRHGPNGRYRVIVLLVTTQQVFADINKQPESISWIADRGDQKLPREVARTPAMPADSQKQPSFVALVYEFRKRLGSKPEQVEAGSHDCAAKSTDEHLVKAGFWNELDLKRPGQ